MKKIFLLLVSMAISILVFSQDTSRVNLPHRIDIRQVKRDFGRLVKYDSIIAIVTYQDKDSVVKTDTCALAVRSRKAYVFENYGQYNKSNLPYGVTLYDQYAIITDWKIYKAVRLQNKKPLYKGRLLNVKYLYRKN